LPPGVFLPVVEDHPLAIEIGEWVIDEVLTQIEVWQDAGLQMQVSVNVSAIQLQQPDFVNRLTEQLAAHPMIAPQKIQIEVLETSALRDIVQTSQVLNACHKIGLSFALDDFGTGYSSLTYLKRLPANVLKIDQSFVSDMLDDPENLNILEGILSLATAFHREVIAEGVETVEHGLMLLYLGCEHAQGYGIARPMQASDVEHWVNTWKPDVRWSNVPHIHAGNKALLAACVEIGAWIAALDSFLMGGRHTPPVIDPDQCRFGKWLKNEQAAGRESDPIYLKLNDIHDQLHELSAEMLRTHAQNKNAEGVARLQELHTLYDDLLTLLGKFQENP
jgi:EAL domain-containing protein (putative c-di-GMP-specific phosphodiesterase class I)